MKLVCVFFLLSGFVSLALGRIDHAKAKRGCEGRILFLTDYGEKRSTSKNFEIGIRRQNGKPVAITDVKVYGNCCWTLKTKRRRQQNTYRPGFEGQTYYRFVRRGIKHVC